MDRACQSRPHPASNRSLTLSSFLAQGWERWLYVVAGVAVVLAVLEAQWQTVVLLMKSPLGG